MNKHSITHNNHYVPRFYLKNWSYDDKTIYTYSLLVSNSKVPYWREESIKNVAVWYDLYTRQIAQQEIDDFETWFDCEFESPVKPVFDRLLWGEQLTKADSILLSKFVAAQHIRTPARLNKILELQRKGFPHIMETTVKRLNRTATNRDFQQILPTISEESNLIPLKVNLDKENSLAKIETLVGKSTYLWAVKHLLTKTITHMYRHRWYVIHAADGISFPTSDDPVICLNFRSESDYDFNGGWGRKHGNIIMPISPQVIVFTQIGDKISCENLNRSPHWSKFFRKIIIEHAHRAVFADKPQKGMLAINPRIVNKELYEKEKEIVLHWHKEQMLAEDQLLRGG